MDFAHPPSRAHALLDGLEQDRVERHGEGEVRELGPPAARAAGTVWAYSVVSPIPTKV